MGEIDTQLLKLYDEEPLFLREVVQSDAELLMLDTWLMETFLGGERRKRKGKERFARGL